MANVTTENHCRNCGWELDTDHRVYECPNCEGHNIWHRDHFTCDCGEEIYLEGRGSVHECESCGKFYNDFGQELAPVDQWDEEDRYGTFGPLNGPNDEDY